MNEGKLDGRKNGKVCYDYRDNIVVDRDSPILAFKANRDRYSPKDNTKIYGGMPLLGSIHSEDAMTWNVFRTMHKDNRLRLMNDLFEEELAGAQMLLWTYAVSDDRQSAELQYTVGNAIRMLDGRHDRKQITEPDVILVTKKSFIVCEAKLGEEGKCNHLWSNSKDKKTGQDSPGPALRYDDYFVNNENPFRKGVAKDDEMYSKNAYQLFRMAFYSYYIAAKLKLQPKLISLTNETWWNVEKDNPREVSSQTWAQFRERIEPGKLFCKNIFWQDIWLSLHCKNPAKARQILSNGRSSAPPAV